MLIVFLSGLSYWVSDCCLTPTPKFFQLYHGKNKLNSMKWWWCPLCTKLTCLVGFFYSASSLKQQQADKHVAPLGHIIPITSQPVFALSP